MEINNLIYGNFKYIQLLKLNFTDFLFCLDFLNFQFVNSQEFYTDLKQGIIKQFTIYKIQ